jgi:hypothetical protein
MTIHITRNAYGKAPEWPSPEVYRMGAKDAEGQRTLCLCVDDPSARR